MSWKYSSKQKEWINELIQKDRISALDELERNWSTGQIEISTFQQKLILHLDADELKKTNDIVVRIMEVCDLFKQLSDDGFIRVWDDIVMEDNTRLIGDKTADSSPHFLPDLGVATELLRWAGKKIQLKDQIIPAAEMEFNDPAIYQANQNRKFIISSLVILVFIFIAGGLFLHQSINAKMDRLQEEISDNKRNQVQSLDSMNLKLDNLYNLSYKMALDSQQVIELRVVSDAVDRTIYQLNNRTRRLEKVIIENQEILRSYDSLLSRLPAAIPRKSVR
ncbi:MAG: hypothetical protein RIA62_00520 [Cyclobacteriaceae bacterium]